MPRSCHGCPSYVNANDYATQVKLYGRAVGVAMCGRLTIPLETLNSDASNISHIRADAASQCNYWGEQWDGKRAPAAVNTVFDVPLTPPPQQRDKAAPISCTGCTKLIRAEQMVRTHGIPFDVCSEFGDPVIGSIANRAVQCQVGERGFESRVDATALKLAKYLDGAVTVINLDGTMDMTNAPPTDHPRDWPTDAPVTPEDETFGIASWRKVTDPEDDDRYILLPVFNPDFFTEVERSKIPQPGDDEHPELYRDHQGLAYKMGALWLSLNETPALSGPAGVGKSEAYRYMAYLMQMPFERISITNSTELDDLAGRWILEKDADTGTNITVFQYGRLPKSWSKPCVVCLDEPNTGPPDVWQFIRPLTDNSKQMVIDMNKGERIDRHKHCFLGMAMNPAWDIRNVGAHEISDADGSRLMHIAVPPPSEPLEREILQHRCAVDGYQLPGNILDSIMKIAKELRDLAAQDDSLSISFGTRMTIKVARASKHFSLKTCFRMACADLVEPQEAERILAIVTSHEPKKLIKPPQYSPGGLVTTPRRHARRP